MAQNICRIGFPTPGKDADINTCCAVSPMLSVSIMPVIAEPKVPCRETQIFNGALKGSHHKADTKQCPSKVTKKSGNCFHPRQVKQFHSHVVHHDKEII